MAQKSLHEALVHPLGMVKDHLEIYHRATV